MRAEVHRAGAGFGVERSETLSTRSVRTTRDRGHLLGLRPYRKEVAGAGFGVERSETLSTRSVRATRDRGQRLGLRPYRKEVAGAGFEPAT